MKKILMIFLVIILAFTVNAQNIVLSSKGKGVSKTNDEFVGFQATFSFDKIESITVAGTERGTFSAITVEGSYSGGETGAPQLPVFRKMIAVPVDATPTVMVKNYTATEYYLADYGINTIFPSQPDMRKDQEPGDIPFAYDEKTYSIDDYNKSPIAEVRIMGTMRGVILGMLEVYPIQYNPVSNTIVVLNDIEVEVIFENGDYKKTEELYAGTFSPYFKDIYSIVLNKGVTRGVYEDHPDLYSNPVRMLVIADRMFEETLQPWFEWKTQKGFYMDVNYTDEIGTTAASIKTFCHNKYNQGINDGTAPTFIVLVGDTPQVPASQIGSSTQKATDLYYATVDGDYFPDMYYSRMSAQTSMQLSNQIEKILYYEQYQFTDPAYLDNVLLIAGWDATWTPRVGMPQINYANTYYYNTEHGYANIHKYTNPYTGCYEHLNNVGFANYTAHCSETSWGNPNYSISQINSLTNVNKYFVAMGNCCLAADFGYSGNGNICFGEAMMHAAQKGAVGYIGSSPSSYWGGDFHFSVGAYAGVIETVTNPTLENTTDGCYDLMFRDADFNCLSSHIFAGNLAVTYAYNAGYTTHVSAHYYWEAYNVLGDGSLMPYNTQANENTVSHLPVVPLGMTSYEVTAVPGSCVAISKDGLLLGVAVTDATGVANVPIDPPVTSGGNVDIVVTRNQYIPYRVQIPAAALSGSYVVPVGYDVVGGGELTYISEDDEIEVTLKNVGSDPTAGLVTVSISSADPQLSIDSGTAQHSGVMAPDGTATVRFSVTVSNAIPDGKIFPVDVTVTSGSKAVWESKLPLTAYAPKLELDAVMIDGVEGGDLEPGSLSILTVSVKNSGGADAYDVIGDLGLDDPYITIACGGLRRGGGGDIISGGSMNFDFYIIVDSSMPYGHQADFDLLLSAQYGISGTFPFSAACSGSDNYCSSGTQNCGDDKFTSVILAKTSEPSVLLINNTSGTCSSGGYQDYTGTNFALEPGEQYTIKVKVGFGSQYVRGWFDLNGNNAFDANEQLINDINSISANTEITRTFTVPGDCVPGSFRFRLVCKYNSAPVACGNSSYGQTHDYTFTVPEMYGRVQDVVAVLKDRDITVTWEAPAEGMPTGYNVYRNGNLLNSSPLTALTCTEENVEQGVYAYNVTALYTGDKESYAEMSNVICYFIACESPANVRASVQGNTAIITWESPESVEGELLRYNIYRDGEKIGEVSAAVLEYQDKGLSHGTYVYRISAAYDHCEESELSAEISVEIQSCEAPVDFAGFAAEDTAVLTWELPTEGTPTGYNIYRDGERITENIAGLEYRDEDLANGTYIYQISAVYGHCESDLTEGVAVVIDDTGISDAQADSFRIFPNPAHNELNITGSVVPVSVRMYNITGQLMYEADQCAAKMKIPVAAMPTGVYFVKIDSEHGSVTKKVVVK